MANVNLKKAEQELAEKLKRPGWRLSNLYKLIDKRGELVTYRPNDAQRYLYREQHDRNVILKARQMGFTHAIALYCLDRCLFTPGTKAGFLAHKLTAAQDIFDNKIKFAYDNLPDIIKEMVPSLNDSARELSFGNHSAITVDTSFRSGTVNLLHISEYGKIWAEKPEKGREIRTGALNTVQAVKGNVIWIESTAEGKSGHFWDLCHKRWNRPQTDLSLMDYKFMFFPWHRDSEYRLDEKCPIPADLKQYFEILERDHEIVLTDPQKYWYVMKAEEQGDDMRREMPSYKEEAFEQAVEGAYFSKQMATIDKAEQITEIPYDPRYPVETFWDLGHADSTAIWFMQDVRGRHNFIDYYEACEQPPEHYARILQERKYVYGQHHLPHDADNELFVGNIRQAMASLGIRPIRVGTRVKLKTQAIEAARQKLPTCWFDKAKCSRGLDCLRAYRKRWIEREGVWSDKPQHDWASHGADGFMEYATNYRGAREVKPIEYGLAKRYA